MATELKVGGLSAPPGERARGSVAAALGKTTVDIPLSLVNGTEPGPRVVITAGVHGGEFTGVDAAVRLADRIAPEDLAGQLVICPVANPPAVYQGRLGVSPLDGININRVFPGDPDGQPTERLAGWLFAHVLDGADAYLDLHSGGIDEVLRDFVGYRVSGDDTVDAKARGIAHAVGIEDVILGLGADGGNSHAAAARRGIPSVLVETGQLGERAAESLVDRLVNVLRHVGMLEGSPQTIKTRAWVWAGGVTAETTGLWYPDFNLGDEVVSGEPIGRIVDPADGREHKVTATATGRVFYAMHGLTVAPGIELAAIAAPHSPIPPAQEVPS
ncbi:MAG TPA: succinylglutamate desuccinylase/aspartoacylase family protein [Amycolatopsis sp.]|uniref:succinylglutamate desuccinylase/aspartoacylase family protein n=1 Tax=Amycolatopsis sp. TaxID=37632 RepID=UPI002B462C64|nr:succinylglutamate desuccinylase/aspartoacylase family protein [Amycolatopsis sp.]HKS48203.1 succinylglutamate desuccinylase/aspartoacylase family protein [Amycolatopsis sp.]